MNKIIEDSDVSTIIPAPRSASRVETQLQGRIEGSQAQAYHHLLDINLQVFESEADAAEKILARAAKRARGTSVYTCNVDHVMLMNTDQRFRDAYESADVVTIDGAPLALLSKWTGTSNASRVTGVDLTVAMIALAAKRGLRVALVGGAEGRATRAAANLRSRFPGLPEMFVDSPRMGFEHGDSEDDRLVAALQAYRPDVVVVCLGAPKQELWIARHRADLPGATLVGAGATIDFLSGYQSRAPQFFQKTGTEAAYRLCTDFRRLWRRYLVRDTRFLLMFVTILLVHGAATLGVPVHSKAHRLDRCARGCAANQRTCHSGPTAHGTVSALRTRQRIGA
ncbi:WecB/TagA/CpsF family glycosyltransferase [Actinomycetospora flava]|uniref:WecB/TagA/CpsF family glycosyltransferase n=1 Tax=Actinomycetospora flava TaxID=3129232 RepID=A0ABU8M7J6_9PSEU